VHDSQSSHLGLDANQNEHRGQAPLSARRRPRKDLPTSSAEHRACAGAYIHHSLLCGGGYELSGATHRAETGRFINDTKDRCHASIPPYMTRATRHVAVGFLVRSTPSDPSRLSVCRGPPRPCHPTLSCASSSPPSAASIPAPSFYPAIACTLFLAEGYVHLMSYSSSRSTYSGCRHAARSILERRFLYTRPEHTSMRRGARKARGVPSVDRGVVCVGAEQDRRSVSYPHGDSRTCQTSRRNSSTTPAHRRYPHHTRSGDLPFLSPLLLGCAPYSALPRVVCSRRNAQPRLRRRVDRAHQTPESHRRAYGSHVKNDRDEIRLWGYSLPAAISPGPEEHPSSVGAKKLFPTSHSTVSHRQSLPGWCW
jgi:hypothetical protein